MSGPDPLDIVLARAGVRGSTLDVVSANILARELGFDAETTSEFVDALQQHGDWYSPSLPPGATGLMIREWRLDLKKTGIRDKIVDAILAATMLEVRSRGISVMVLSAIISSILDIERVSLTDDNRRLLVEVQQIPGVADGSVSVEELYQDLPMDIQDQVDLSDFKELIALLRLTGHVVEGTTDDTVRVREPGERIPRIRWK